MLLPVREPFDASSPSRMTALQLATNAWQAIASKPKAQPPPFILTSAPAEHVHHVQPCLPALPADLQPAEQTLSKTLKQQQQQWRRQVQQQQGTLRRTPPGTVNGIIARQDAYAGFSNQHRGKNH
jgi:hypothetical protein